jgi:hypothetical protein
MKSSKHIKTFEARLADNEGIPNPSGKMSDIKRKAQGEIGDYQRQGKVVPPHHMFSLIQDVERIEASHRDKIVALSIEIVKSEYGNLLDDIDLDVKLSGMGSVVRDMKSQDDDFEVLGQPKPRSTKPDNAPKERSANPGDESTARSSNSGDELKAEIDKRKIANLISQGESKNALRLFHMFKNEIDAIDPRLFDMYDKIFKSNEAIEWMMPEQGMGQQMYNNQNMIGGMVSVDWGNDQPNEKTQRSAEDILADIAEGGDLHGNEEEIEELLSQGNPKILVRASSLPLLVHEIIKGIYELIAARGIPENPEMAQDVIDQTDTFEDEMEDLKYGKYIKNDFVEFIMENPKAGDIPNLKEFVFGEMMAMPAHQFVSLFKGIMEKTGIARRKVDAIIDGIIDMFNEYENDAPAEVDYAPSTQPAPANGPVDYAKVSKRELQTMLDDALDKGDYATVGKISPFLESKRYGKAKRRK